MPTDKVDNLFAFTKLQNAVRKHDNLLRSSQRKLKLKAQYIHASQCHASRSSKKTLLEKDTYEYVQINIADITK